LKNKVIWILTTSLLGLASDSDAAAPKGPANPFNVNVPMNAPVSPVNPVAGQEIKKRRKLILLGQLLFLAKQNLELLNLYIQQASNKVADLQQRLDDDSLSSDDESVLEDRLNLKEDRLAELESIRQVFFQRIGQLDAEVIALRGD
jgi:hypothetical protein